VVVGVKKPFFWHFEVLSNFFPLSLVPPSFGVFLNWFLGHLARMKFGGFVPCGRSSRVFVGRVLASSGFPLGFFWFEGFLQFFDLFRLRAGGVGNCGSCPPPPAFFFS